MAPLATLLILAQVILARDYDPLARSPGEIRHIDAVVNDRARRRDLPLRIYLPPEPAAAPGAAPSTAEPAPVVLFSHGLGGSCRNNPYLGEHWASRGFVAVFVQHPGSDEGLWRGVPLGQRMDALKRGATGQNLHLRVQDVPAVIDQLARWNALEGHPLHGRLDLEHVGMSGHSFGAMTTQALSGQTALMEALAPDPRIDAAVIMSPSAPSGPGIGAGAVRRTFSSVRIPWLLMTGTLDEAPVGSQSVESRLKVFPALPPGDKYELVLWKGQHSAFGDAALPGEELRRNPNHHRVILALSAAFWDAYLRDDPRARAWLHSNSKSFGPRAVLEEQDRWQWK